jgi:hypothetical protein
MVAAITDGCASFSLGLVRSIMVGTGDVINDVIDGCAPTSFSSTTLVMIIPSRAELNRI